MKSSISHPRVPCLCHTHHTPTVTQMRLLLRRWPSGHRRVSTVPLAYNVYKSLDGSCIGKPPLLIAHGLFGSKTNWNSMCKALQRRLNVQVYAMDLRNHGDSPHVDPMTYEAMAADLARFVNDIALPQAQCSSVDILGHSMGGKAVALMALNGNNAAHLRSIIIEDVMPKAYSDDADHIKVLDDYIGVMMELEEEDDLSTFPSLPSARRHCDKALRRVVTNDAIRAFLLTNLRQSPEGICWKINLGYLRTHLADVTGFPSEVDGRYDGPTLVMSGQNSNYVSEEDMPSFVERFPLAELVTIADAGHWIHAEQPTRFIDALCAFLHRL